jgi:hypothetical protein
VILDHHLPGKSGADSVPELRASGFDGPILLFTQFLTEAMPSIRVPLDVWPVSKADPDTVMELLGSYRDSLLTSKPSPHRSSPPATPALIGAGSRKHG